MLTSNKNICFSYNQTFYTKLLLQNKQNKQNTCTRRPYYNTVNYLLYREQETPECDETWFSTIQPSIDVTGIRNERWQ